MDVSPLMIVFFDLDSWNFVAKTVSSQGYRNLSQKLRFLNIAVNLLGMKN